jgi:acyl-CoA reductase-like NAD-dependent aldehyde dehydrogenase
VTDVAEMTTDTLPTFWEKELVVVNPFDESTIGHVEQHSPEDIDQILDQAQAGAETARAMPRHARATVLDGAAGLLQERATQVANMIVCEAGKTIRQARKEVTRAANTLRLSAAESRRNAGEVVPFDSFEGSENRQGWFTREPLGIIAAITPYNDALNLVAHKLGPAIAGGNSIILKPSQLTPLTARLLVDLLEEAGLPRGVITTVHGDRELAQALVSARIVRMVSFTGGFATGEAIAKTAGLKRLAMELGGNAPVLVFDDADIDAAVESCVSGAFWAAGQNCIGTQRILVQRNVFQRFRDRFVAGTAELKAGDPTSELTDVGPMISRAVPKPQSGRLTTQSRPAPGYLPEANWWGRYFGRLSWSTYRVSARSGARKCSPRSLRSNRSIPPTRRSHSPMMWTMHCTQAFSPPISIGQSLSRTRSMPGVS